jgi:diguanylate cyclase (GGDEF)-like protein
LLAAGKKIMVDLDRKKALRTLDLISILALLLVIAIWSAFQFVHDENKLRVFSDITAPTLNAFATLALFLGAKRTYQYSKIPALGWGLLALAQAIYTLGDISWVVLELVFSISPFPSVADIFYSLYYPFFFAGILLLTTTRNRPDKWYKQALDMGIIMLASTLIMWNYLLGQTLISNSEAPLLTQILSVAYPVGDLMVIGAIVLLWLRQVDQSNGMGILYISASAVMMVVADSTFSFQFLVGTYISGQLVDLCWYISSLLMALAGTWQYLIAARRQNLPSSAFLIKSFDNLNGLTNFLPYVSLFAVLALLLQSCFYSFPMPSWMITIGVIVIIVLILMHHVVVRLENQRLFKELDLALQQTRRQAQDLEFEIKERKRIEGQLLHDTSHDGLTGLPNRVLLLDRLEQVILYAKNHPDFRAYVLFLDIDNFNYVNDSLGHDAGDRLLILISQRLKNCLQSQDTLVRVGGDEFIILLENGERDTILSMAHHILNQFTSPFNLNGQDTFITTSIGVALLDQTSYDTPFDILRDADIALGQAKLAGKASIKMFHPELRKQARERYILENDLRHAIEQREFVLYYQPIISLDNNEMISFEALIRWKNPERGLIMPDKFIPLAEETGLVVEIGKWVLEEACRQIIRWQKQFPDKSYLSIHVNISGKQLKQPDFVDQLKQILSETAINPDCLKLEITESVFVENQDISQIYTELRALGVHLEIDDFGTGYSSLSYLQHIPVDIIKIDRSFIAEINREGRAIELVRAMMGLAFGLGIRVIAEGIETREQLAMLKELKCNFGQGYLFSRPVDLQAAGEMIKNKPQLQPKS